jgi:hypothetical protein
MARARLTHDDYQTRLQAYCARYDARPTDKGVPPYPANRRETQQHREWMALHRLHDRLSRRDRGQCQRCPEPALEGGLYCAAHVSAASSGLEPAQREELHAAQSRVCSVCEEPLDITEARLFERSGTRGEMAEARSLVHAECLRLITLVEAAGPGVLTRLRRLLGPGGPPKRRGAA